MITHLQRRWGGGGKDPKDEDLREALGEVRETDPEHPDCWLSDENGWTIAAHESGAIVLENVESGEGPWHMKDQTAEAVLKLWRLLQLGDVATIRAEQWVEGYGG